MEKISLKKFEKSAVEDSGKIVGGADAMVHEKPTRKPLGDWTTGAASLGMTDSGTCWDNVPGC